MKRKSTFPCTIYIVVLLGLFVFLADCGRDEAAPADPSTTSVIPDIVFFNTVDPSAVILFEGRATDNIMVQTVLISFENGAVWHTADIDNSSPNTLRNVEWSYLASAADIPAAMNTVLIRALDGDANEVTSPPIPIEKQSGAGISALETVFSGAADGQVIALSSGIGGAYGDSATALSIPIEVGLTVLGSGYGSTSTSGGVSFPAVASTATILQAPVSSAKIFSVDADLTLKNLRLLGAEIAVHIWDSADLDPQLSVEDCVFDGQGAWAVYAEDGDGGVSVEFVSSVVDASFADSSSRGGLLLDNVAYRVEESGFYFHTDPGGPTDNTDQGAAVHVVDGAGEIAGSIFEKNALAIWASGGSPVITSCNISGAAFTTYGINLTGGPATPVLRNNRIRLNSGYGVRIGGTMKAKVRRSVISSNGLSGILISFSGPTQNLQDIDLGKFSDFGYNDLFGNTHPSAVPTSAEVFVSAGVGSTGNFIPAEKNYWGVAVGGLVPSRIYDGVDTNNRAIVNFGGDPFNFPQN